MTKAKRIAAHLAGILIFAFSSTPMALAEEAASVQPVESVQIAQAENDGRYNDSRPVTVGDLYRLQDQQSTVFAGPVRVAQAENTARYGDSRPVTVGDLYRFQDQQNEQIQLLSARIDKMETQMNARMDRIEDELSHLGGRLDLALTVMLGGLLGIVAVLLARREKPAASARLNTNQPPPTPAH